MSRANATYEHNASVKSTISNNPTPHKQTIFTKTLPALHNLCGCLTQRTLPSLFLCEMTGKMLSPQPTRWHTACVAFPSNIFVSETVEEGRRGRRHRTQRKTTKATPHTVPGDTEGSDKERAPVWQEHQERHDEHGTRSRHEPRTTTARIATTRSKPATTSKCNNGASIRGLQCHHEQTIHHHDD